jgi:hypothetical protein
LIKKTNFMPSNILYQNNWCKIVLRGTYYVLVSKSGKYNDRYFQTLDSALKTIGVRTF